MKQEHSLRYIASTFNLSMSQIAREINVTPQTINDWTNGKRNIPEKRLKQLASYFDLPEEYFQKELLSSEKFEIQKKYIANDELRHSEVAFLSGQQEKAKLIERFTDALEHDSKLLKNILHLLDTEDKQRVNMLKDVAHYLVFKKGFDTTLDKEVKSKLDEIYKIYKEKGD
ncbi:helix-turn-helix domain-containing protein [Virgibacillus sp. CBA3643]|uniref:helix-turn-helix domain-containing protein n=1 Tax=Virgibacillus sp. CBA3643 TaxID=2942278 RepID=UPI0035A2A900